MKNMEEFLRTYCRTDPLHARADSPDPIRQARQALLSASAAIKIMSRRDPEAPVDEILDEIRAAIGALDAHLRAAVRPGPITTG